VSVRFPIGLLVIFLGSWAVAAQSTTARVMLSSCGRELRDRLLEITRKDGPEIPFYRIIEGGRPGVGTEFEAAALTELEELYGTKHLIFTDEIAKQKKPILVRGYLWIDSDEHVSWFKATHGTNFPQAQIGYAREFAAGKATDMAKTFRPHAPDAIARSEDLKDILQTQLGGAEFRNLLNANSDEALRKLQAKLHEMFPDGFVVKPSDGWSSDGAFLAEGDDFVAVYQNYLENIKPRMIAAAEKGTPPNELHLAMKGTPDYYEGMTIDQEKLPNVGDWMKEA